MSVRSKVVTIVENDKHDYKKTKKERKKIQVWRNQTENQPWGNM